MTQDWRRQPAIVEISGVSKWVASPRAVNKRYHQNEALNTLIELMEVGLNAGRLGKGSPVDALIEKVLDDVSVKIPRGCVVGVIDVGGRSKSALLEIVGNVQLANQGEVRLFGRSASLRQVNLFSRAHATCRQNLVSSARIVGLSRAKIEYALQHVPSFSGLGQYLDLPQRRVPKWVLLDLGISLLCCLELDLLVIEECDCATSQKVKRSWREFVRRAPEMDKTLLIGGRRTNSVFELSTHLLLLKDGRLLDFGPVKELREQHADFLRAAAVTPMKNARIELAEDEDEDDEEEGENEDVVTSMDPILASEAEQSQIIHPRKVWTQVRLDYNPDLFVQTAEVHSKPVGLASSLCRIQGPTRAATAAENGASQLLLLSTTDSGSSSEPSLRGAVGGRLVIPVETLVSNLRLRPELEFTCVRSKGPLLRLLADQDIFVSDPSRLLIEAHIPPNRLAPERYIVDALLGAAQGASPQRLLCARESLKLRVLDHEGAHSAESDCDLYGSGVWWLQRADRDDPGDGLFLSLPGSDREAIARTQGGVARVDRSEDLQFSTVFAVERAENEISAWLKLTTPTGHSVGYRMPSPERITQPGDYRLSVIVPRQELGCSLFRVTMMISIGAETRNTAAKVRCEGLIAVENTSDRGSESSLTGTLCAMELEQRWSAQYADHVAVATRTPK